MGEQQVRHVKWFRLLGVLVLLWLVWRSGPIRILQSVSNANLFLVALAVLLNFPLILLKVIRWRSLLQSAQIRYGLVPSSLAYSASIFLGTVTPGRVGEFAKVAQVSQDCDVPMARVFPSVVADRLFDLHALLLVSGWALLSLPTGTGRTGWLSAFLLLAVVLLTGSWVLLSGKQSFSLLRRMGLRGGQLGQRLFAPAGWMVNLHLALRQVTLARLLVATALTTAAYAIFFNQCYLLALSLGLHRPPLEDFAGTGQAEFSLISGAVALGNLAALLPVSISGLGTRDAAIVAYLATAGIHAHAALGFSLLVFATFNVGGGLMGAIAWWIKPPSLSRHQLPGSSRLSRS